MQTQTVHRSIRKADFLNSNLFEIITPYIGETRGAATPPSGAPTNYNFAWNEP